MNRRVPEPMAQAAPNREAITKPTEFDSIFRDMFAASPFGILVHDSGGKILAFNPRLEQITGYAAHEVPDIPTWLKLIYPEEEYRKIVLAELRQETPAGAARLREAMITCRDGQKAIYRFTSSRLESGLRVVFIQPAEESATEGPPALEAEHGYRILHGSRQLPSLLWLRQAEDFMLVTYNAAAQDLMGGRLALALGRKQNELFALHPQVSECLRACLRENRSLHTELWWETGGEDSRKHLRLTFICAAAALVRLNIEDLTRIKQAEEEIIRREQRFQQLVDMLPETVCELDKDGRITFMNRIGFERFGITAEDLQRGLTPWELMLPEDRQRALENIGRELRGERPVGPNEYTAVTRDGRHIPHIVIARPIAEEGKIAGLTVLVIDITERKKLEATLRDNEERLRLGAGAARIGIYATDLETDSRQWSPEMYAITGQDPGAIKTDQEAWSIVHPEDRDRVLEIHRRALEPAGKGLYYSEHRIIRPDGEVRWVAWRGQTLFRDTPSGRVPTRRIGACIDITKRKQAEIALQVSEKKFFEVFHASPHGLAITTFDEGRYLEANRTESALTGYSREELIGRTAFELGFYVDPEDGRFIRRLLTRYGTFNNYKIRFRRKSGEIRWGLASTSLIDFDGQKCLLWNVSDITDLRNAEEALKLSEERLRMATEGATIAWWDWDIRSDSAVCNDIYYTMLGYAPQEFPLSYQGWLELVFPDDRSFVITKFNKALAGSLPAFTAEYRIRCKDGSWRWILGNGRVFERDKDGTASRFIGVHIDIHDRKAVEERLHEANQDLEERVHARTAALAELNESLRSEISARRAAENELRARTDELAEINNALRVFLRKSREECEENIVKTAASIRQLAFPHLEKLRLAPLSGRQAAYLQLLEEALLEITSPDFSSLSDLQRRLTPSEYQVAWLIRKGHTTKQLSETLSLSSRTVESHRKSIRKKLGLQHSKTNLRSHLASIGNLSSASNNAP